MQQSNEDVFSFHVRKTLRLEVNYFLVKLKLITACLGLFDKVPFDMRNMPCLEKQAIICLCK